MEFLCCLLAKPKYLNFSFPELASLATLEGVKLPQLLSHYSREIEGRRGDDVSEEFSARCRANPALFVRLPSVEAAVRMLERSVCIDKFLQVYTSGPSVESLISDLMSRPQADLMSMISDANVSFAFYVDYFQFSLPWEEQLKVINLFDPLPFKGKVDPINPDMRFWVVRDLTGTYFFGKEEARLKTRSRFFSKYSLSVREYLGPTSTDNELAFLMVNEARVTASSLVLDPFVGTGSILVAAQHFGALCFGSDIDMRVLKGMSVGRSTKETKADIFTNFQNYRLNPPEILRMDNSTPAWGREGVFDAIVCDPPYGIRARSRTAGKKKDEDQSFVPDTNQYESGKLIGDLIDMAARLLCVGGRLVFLLPTGRAEYRKERLPGHPFLRLIANSENVLSRKISRRLLTYERVEERQVLTGEEDSGFYTGLRKVWFGGETQVR